MTTARPGRPPRYPADRLRKVNYLIKTSIAAAIKAEAERRGISQGDMIAEAVRAAGMTAPAK